MEVDEILSKVSIVFLGKMGFILAPVKVCYCCQDNWVEGEGDNGTKTLMKVENI